MTLPELKKEAYLQVLRLAAIHGYADMDIQVSFRPNGTQRKPEHRDITQYFCEEYGIGYDILYSRSHKASICIPRQMAQYCMYLLCGISQIDIAKITARDHSTITYTCKTIKSRMDVDKNFNEKMQSHIANLI